MGGESQVIAEMRIHQRWRLGARGEEESQGGGIFSWKSQEGRGHWGWGVKRKFRGAEGKQGAVPAPGSQRNQRTCWDPRPWAPEPEGSVVGERWRWCVELCRGAGSGVLSPDLATPSPATGALGLWFSSQAFALSKQEVFELADSLVSETSAVGGRAGNAVEGVRQLCTPLLPSR